jgi:hypothetical protein
LRAPDDCLNAQDIKWILDHSASGAELTLSDIEKAALRALALKLTGDLARAASLLGMARVSLERWIRRRSGDSSETVGGIVHEENNVHGTSVCDGHVADDA